MAYRRFAWAEVSSSAIAHNVRTLKRLTAPGTLFMAVVKADGYGHGALEAARAALGAGADRLGVATLEEAATLRDAGITAALHLLSEPPVSGAGLAVELDVIPAVTTLGFATALSREATRTGRSVRYHLKVDSGMSRIGVRADEAPGTAVRLAALPSLEMEGVFTHFATADVPGDWEFERQVERFMRAVEQMKNERIKPPIVHAANSAATILHPEAHFGMVRCGIAIYGLDPAPSTYGTIDLEPAMAVKARVSFVKRIGLGEGVSYGFTYHASGPTTIATLPLGYADGVHRAASNAFEVLLSGRRCPQVGRVCMDQFMVEVPAGVEVAQGAEAVIVGSQAGERISMDELANHAGTINYELACGFALRLDRRVV